MNLKAANDRDQPHFHAIYKNNKSIGKKIRNENTLPGKGQWKLADKKTGMETSPGFLYLIQTIINLCHLSLLWYVLLP